MMPMRPFLVLASAALIAGERTPTTGRGNSIFNCFNARALAVLFSPLAAWPQAHRTNFHLITRYEKGTVLGAWYPGNPGIPEPVWTIGRW